MKWEPIAIMILVLGLGFWVAYGPATPHALREGATTTKFTIGAAKGELEILDPSANGRGSGEVSGRSFRFLPKAGEPSGILSEPQLRAMLGNDIVDQAINTGAAGNRLFRALNITGWGSFVWLSVGFLGQILFSGRMVLQWISSEKKKQSHVPPSFWWFSLIGGILLFTYFAWRQDPIGVLGQSSGLVIYARNLRLIAKEKRRAGTRS